MAEQTEKKRERPMTADERRTVVVLGLPTFALALAATTVASYLPVVAREFTESNLAIGLLIGGEGLMALWLPLAAGVWSDRLDTRFGGRVPFVIAAIPMLALALATMGFAGSLVFLVPLVLLFFIGYFLAYEPYRALYPDLLDDEVAGRGQSSQAVFRGVGTGLALASGGVLLGIGTALPFVASAVAVSLALGAFVWLVTRRGVPPRDTPPDRDVRAAAARLRELIGDHPVLRWYLVANALWELSIAALRTFVVLYITRGLGFSIEQSSLFIGLAAVFVLGGAVVSGKLADRFGKTRTMLWSLPVFGVGLLVPAFTDSPAAVAAVAPVVAAGGGIVMSLPYALLIPLMPQDEHGALTGYYSLSRGLGTLLGPLLAGVAVTVLGGLFESTEGYGAMWLVSGGAILLSIPALLALASHHDDRAQLREQ